MKEMRDSELKAIYGEEKMTLYVERDDGGIDDNGPMAVAVDHWKDERMVVDKEQYNAIVRYVNEDVPNDEHFVLKVAYGEDVYSVKAVAESPSYVALELKLDR